MRAFSVLSAALFATTAWALTVTTPSEDTTWDATKQSQSISWTSVSSDTSNFSIALVNMVRFYDSSA